MSSENYELNTIKGHGLSVGDRFHFYGMGSDAIPTAEGTRVALEKCGNKYMIVTVTGDVHTWEFGTSAKVWADTTIKHEVTTDTRTMSNGDVVYVGKCEHGWETGFHTTDDDAYAVAEGHGEVSRPLYAATVLDTVEASLAAEVDAFDAAMSQAMDALKTNGRVFVAEVHNFGGLKAFDALVEARWATLVFDEGMSRYIRTIRTADRGRAPITDGMAVWDYNLNPGRVVLSSVDQDGWFYVDTANAGRSLMNGDRVWTVHPITGASAESTLSGPSLGAMADSMAEVNTVHAAALAAEAHTIVGKRAWGPNGLQGTIESTYSDGSINLVTFGVSNIVPAGKWKLMPSVEIHTGDGTVITESDVKARVRQAFGTKVTESEVWAGTGTMIKSPIRTKLGRRSRRSARRARRGIKGGF